MLLGQCTVLHSSRIKVALLLHFVAILYIRAPTILYTVHSRTSNPTLKLGYYIQYITIKYSNIQYWHPQ